MSVEQIQRALNAHGYNLAVDGVNGPKTKAAIKDFQRKHNLTVDGIVGPNTTRALQGGSGDLPGGPAGIGGRQGGGGPNDQGGKYRVGGLKSLMLRAGANEKEASTLAAIAMAESSGNSRAVNTGNSNGTYDYGLWQVNSIWTNDGRSHEQGRYDHNQLTTDPLYNAKAALDIYRSSGYSAWATFNNGAYKQYVDQAASASAEVPPAVASPVSGTAAASTGGGYTGGIEGEKTWGWLQHMGDSVGIRGMVVTPHGRNNGKHATHSYHYRNEAFDWSNAGNDPYTNLRFAQYLYDHYKSQLTELIFEGPGGQRIGVKNGKDFNYSDATYAGHRDHVHTAATPAQIRTGAPSVSGDQSPSGSTDQYAWLRALAGTDPDLNRILREADQGATDEKILNDLHNTHWWRTHDLNARTLAALQTDDPAEYTRQHDAYTQQMRQLMGSMGVTLGGGEFDTVFNLAFGQGWNTQQLQSYLSRYFSIRGVTPVGAAGSAVFDLKSLAAQYAVPLSDATLQKWTRQIIAGTVTSDNFKTYLIEQAKGLYPTLAKALDKGITVDQYAEPYRQVAAQTLNVNPNQIDFRQAKWQAPLMQVDKTGERVPMSLDQWATRLKTDPTYGFDTTSVARDTAAKFSSDLLTQFGAKG